MYVIKMEEVSDVTMMTYSDVEYRSELRSLLALIRHFWLYDLFS